ncbi:MAG: 23S rRNA (pseudouridine(1915)-N(3))-methyltransferase RlmH [Lachnospiraceae bacterium]|jgi:23S rRNA (pseudouridine1915-N3)-methyltransferase|nr:23S rRNA (pseudouridine(1915)-N(3))-methyltransferase RlmH [Lachnospiraceae bacterium]
MKITIIAVGKIKESYWRAAIEEYRKRLQKYCKLTIIEVEDEKTPDRASALMNDQIREKEAGRILAALTKDGYVVTLEIDGKPLDSPGLADFIDRLGVRGTSHIQFIIGGSLGLHSSVTARADRALSCSAMTFPHQLMRVILLEQIYRGYRIIAGEPYHK